MKFKKRVLVFLVLLLVVVVVLLQVLSVTRNSNEIVFHIYYIMY